MDVHISHLEDPWATKDRAALILKQLSRYAYAFAVSTPIPKDRTRDLLIANEEKSKLRRGASIT
jgi:hypothetical protein